MRIAGISAFGNNLGDNQLKNQSRAQQPSFGNFKFAKGVMQTFDNVNQISSHPKLTNTVNSMHIKKIPLSDFVLFNQVEALKKNPICKNLGKEFNDLTINILEIVDDQHEKDVYATEWKKSPTTGERYRIDVGEPISKMPVRSVKIRYSIPALRDFIPEVEFEETVPINHSDISGTLPELLHREEVTFRNLSSALEHIQKKVDGIVSRFATALTRENPAQTTKHQ